MKLKGRKLSRYRLIYKSGGSYVITIPYEIMNKLGISAGDMMIVKDEANKIIIERVRNEIHR